MPDGETVDEPTETDTPDQPVEPGPGTGDNGGNSGGDNGESGPDQPTCEYHPRTISNLMIWIFNVCSVIIDLLLCLLLL